VVECRRAARRCCCWNRRVEDEGEGGVEGGIGGAGVGCRRLNACWCFWFGWVGCRGRSRR
jgi:hypothetical protein